MTNHPWFPWIFLDAKNFTSFKMPHPGKMGMVGHPTETSKSNRHMHRESKDQRNIFVVWKLSLLKWQFISIILNEVSVKLYNKCQKPLQIKLASLQ